VVVCGVFCLWCGCVSLCACSFRFWWRGRSGVVGVVGLVVCVVVFGCVCLVFGV
jgi:hypothetical protein